MIDFKSKLILFLYLLGPLILLFKAVQLQFWDTSYSEKAKNNTMSKKTIYPARGLIYDRNSNLLINNQPVYDLMCTYNQVPENIDTARFCELLDITKETFDKNINKNWRSVRYSKRVPFVFLKKIPPITYARLQESLYEYPGFFVNVRNIRTYPDSIGCHLLGYISEASPKEISDSLTDYKAGDYLGKTGLELIYEKELRGTKGIEFVLKDNLGRTVGSFQGGELDSNAVAGQDLITTIDLELQRYGEKLMQGKTGAIVALQPETGEILSMVSAPTYNPNDLIVNRNRGKAFEKLLTDTLKPFFDRSVQAKYPPGSLFKSIVALIAMQEGVLAPNQGFTCNGGYTYRGHRWGCHAHPPVNNVSKAITYSCNTYFYQTFRNIVDKYSFYNPQRGLDTFVNHLYDFGMGHKLGIDFPGEKAGNVPTSKYYDKVYPRHKGSWKSPTIVSVGIGQGEMQLTTLQMANLAAIIGNKGWYWTPHLVKEFKDEFNNIQEVDIKYKKVRVDSQYFTPIVDGMENVVEFGTARLAQVPGISVCGKTGTAQNPHGKDHSIFFAFAPKENPKIAIAVYVENAGYGGSYAAPIASLMIEKFINDSIVAPNRTYLEDRMLNLNLIEAQ